MQRTMRGAPNAMAFWTAFPYMLETCSAGGERTLRHHAVRDVIYRWAERAGSHPEREKPGLLLPQRPEDTGLGRRRPADVFVPSLAGIPTALDIAVTAPQRSESLREASGKAVAAADAYADVKADHLQTAQVCENQGVRFQPMVVESTGAWSTSASHTLRLLARATAAREGEDAASCYTHLLQELCVTARRFRGRAALRRRAELVSPTEADVTRRDAALLLATAASSSWSWVWSHLLRLQSIAFATIAIQTPGQQFSLLAQQNSVGDMCSGIATPLMATVTFCITIGETLCKWLASSFISSYPSHATKSWLWKCAMHLSSARSSFTVTLSRHHF